MVPGAHRVYKPNGISIGSAVFAWLTIVGQTDRRTDHATPSVTIDRLNNMQRLTCRVSVLKRRVAGAIMLIRFPRTFAFLLRILANLTGAV